MELDQVMENWDNLEKWKLDARVRERIKDTGFDGLLRLSAFPVKHNLPLLSALVDCYDTKNRCFVFNSHKVVFGLEDVLYITGLPIDGKPVTGIDSKGNELCKKYLGRNGCDEKNAGVTSLAWLREKFEVVPEYFEKDSREIEPYVRAYILYLMGSVVVPDNSGKYVPVMYLSLMENLQNIKEFAWGAALLAHLHVSLETSKKYYSRKTKLMGHSYSLMVFAMERIPELPLNFCSDSFDLVSDLPATFPLLAGWAKLLSETPNTYKRIPKQYYLQIFRKLEEEDILWQPYCRLPCDFLPPYCSKQEKMSLSRTVLLCFEKAAYHRPDLSPKQFGIQELDTSMLPPLKDLELQTRSGRKGIDWGTYGDYKIYKKEWELRASCLIIEPVEDGPCCTLLDAPVSPSCPSHIDPSPQSSKRRRVENAGKIEETSSTKVDAYGSTSCLPLEISVQTESQVIPSVHSLDIIDLDHIKEEPDRTNMGILTVSSDQEFSDDHLSSLLANANDLLQGSATHAANVRQAAVASAKETIRRILYRGFDALTNSDMQKAFLASSECLSSAGVFPPGKFRTELETFRNELPQIATAFLGAQKDMDMASEFSSLQEFLSEQASRLHSLEECLRVADGKIADLQATLDVALCKRARIDDILAGVVGIITRAMVIGEADKNIAQFRALLDNALEKRYKMDEVRAAFDEKTKKAKLKLASMGTQAADILSKQQAAKMLIKQCQSSWLNLASSLLGYL